MSYSITAVDNKGNDIARFYYKDDSPHDKHQERILHKVLGVGYIRDQNKIEKKYSKGQLLQAKSELVKINGVLGELDFIESCLVEFLVNPNKITITFN